MLRRPQLELQCGQAQHSHSPRWAQCPWRTGDAGKFSKLHLLNKLSSQNFGALTTGSCGSCPYGQYWHAQRPELTMWIQCERFILVWRKRVPCAASARFDISVTWSTSSCFNTRFERANLLTLLYSVVLFCTFSMFKTKLRLYVFKRRDITEAGSIVQNRCGWGVMGKDSQVPVVTHYPSTTTTSSVATTPITSDFALGFKRSRLRGKSTTTSYHTSRKWQTCYQDDSERGRNIQWIWVAKIIILVFPAQRAVMSPFITTFSLALHFYLHLYPVQMQVWPFCCKI